MSPGSRRAAHADSRLLKEFRASRHAQDAAERLRVVELPADVRRLIVRRLGLALAAAWRAQQVTQGAPPEQPGDREERQAS